MQTAQSAVTENAAERLGYRVRLNQDGNGQWVATAHRLDDGDTFGPRVTARSAEEAEARLVAWLEWQRDHAAALAALQSASAAYYRLVVQGYAGGSSSRRPEIEAALASLDEARRALDAVRERSSWQS